MTVTSIYPYLRGLVDDPCVAGGLVDDPRDFLVDDNPRDDDALVNFLVDDNSGDDDDLVNFLVDDNSGNEDALVTPSFSGLLEYAHATFAISSQDDIDVFVIPQLRKGIG